MKGIKMEFDSNLELAKKVELLIQQLDKKGLSEQELDELVDATHRLHERALIVRYKAKEEKVFGKSQAENSASSGPVAPLEVESKNHDAVQEVESSAEDDFGFELGFFEQEKETIEEAPSVEKTEQVIEEKVVTKEDSPSEPVVEEVIEESHFSLPTADGSQNFVSLFKQITQAHGAGVGHSKLESLIGSFGLNERLQYINELFDGSSEQFSEAIKVLDAQSGIDAAYSLAASFAEQNNWMKDSETIVEFIQKLNRRYA